MKTKKVLCHFFLWILAVSSANLTVVDPVVELDELEPAPLLKRVPRQLTQLLNLNSNGGGLRLLPGLPGLSRTVGGLNILGRNRSPGQGQGSGLLGLSGLSGLSGFPGFGGLNSPLSKSFNLPPHPLADIGALNRLIPQTYRRLQSNLPLQNPLGLPIPLPLPLPLGAPPLEAISNDILPAVAQQVPVKPLVMDPMAFLKETMDTHGKQLQNIQLRQNELMTNIVPLNLDKISQNLPQLSPDLNGFVPMNSIFDSVAMLANNPLASLFGGNDNFPKFPQILPMPAMRGFQIPTFNFSNPFNPFDVPFGSGGGDGSLNSFNEASSGPIPLPNTENQNLGQTPPQHHHRQFKLKKVKHHGKKENSTKVIDNADRFKESKITYDDHGNKNMQILSKNKHTGQSTFLEKADLDEGDRHVKSFKAITRF